MRLEGTLAKCVGVEKSVRLRLTSNRYTIVSVKRGPDRYDVRVHQMFSQADENVVSALSQYVLCNDPDAATFLGKFIDCHRHQIEAQPKRQRRVAIRTAGQHHDLRAIFKRLNAHYFTRPIRAKITWGMAARRSERRSIMVGSYSVEDRLIRVHPVLDRAEVPEFFVEWIVFHEMLHAKHPIRKIGGRRCFHPPAFLDEERCFAQWEQAQRWQTENLERLLKG
jgi:predicted metal-dependent hydrolase